MDEVAYLEAVRAHRTSELRRTLRKGVDAVTAAPALRSVRRRPWTSALLSTASGFLVGRNLGRARVVVRPLLRLAAGPLALVLRAGLMQAWAGMGARGRDTGPLPGRDVSP